MDYIRPGTRVTIDTGEPGDGVRGVVVAVTLDTRGVAGYRCDEWLEAHEVEEEQP